jgi:hypothetical protein
MSNSDSDSEIQQEIYSPMDTVETVRAMRTVHAMEGLSPRSSLKINTDTDIEMNNESQYLNSNNQINEYKMEFDEPNNNINSPAEVIRMQRTARKFQNNDYETQINTSNTNIQPNIQSTSSHHRQLSTESTNSQASNESNDTISTDINLPPRRRSRPSIINTKPIIETTPEIFPGMPSNSLNIYSNLFILSSFTIIENDRLEILFLLRCNLKFRIFPNFF